MIKKVLKFIGLGIAVYLLTLLLMRQGYFAGIQQRLTNASYDDNNASSKIVIVTIDEKSLQSEQLGSFGHWKRAYYTQAIQTLRAAGAKVIGIDVTFPDPSSAGAEDDQALADELKQAPDVVLASRYYFENGERKTEWPNAELMSAAPTVGWINVQLSDDGFVRQVPIFEDYQGKSVEAFSLQIARKYLGAPPVDYRIQNDTFTFTPGIEIPAITQYDPQKDVSVYTMHTNYFAKPNGFTHVSFLDVLTGNFTDKRGKSVDFKDKIVLIGPTATDLQDNYLSPVSEGVRMPGVEIHANNLQTILEKKFLRDQSQKSLWIELAVLLVINLVAFAVLKISLALLLLAAELGILLIAGIVGYEFQLLLNAVYPLFLIVATFVGAFLLRLVLEQKQRQFLKQAFGHYVNKEVVEAILKNPKMLELGGAKKEITVLFSDIAGFTSISEKMAPEALVPFLNEYLEEMTKIILDTQGTLDKYEGDGLMCFWGAPLPDVDHAKKACQTALLQQQRLVELRKKWRKQGKPEIYIRIGVNTGDAVVGNMGSKNRFDYTATGDTVNLGSRLEGINKQYGTAIMISEFTYAQIKNDFVCRELDLVRVKGKEKAVRIYELIGGKNSKLKIENLKFEEALALYRERKFEEAKAAFYAIADDPAVRVFAERCEHFLEDMPPEDWDGAWEFSVK
ncbi:adenylate/guanylate cyclase domain-containing protein [Candidatus Peregrinibacteria bacterium]|nr:adenylate/guanylate cyclase domain-containing protein [Candidatus Peregrinibacteria bacterium]